MDDLNTMPDHDLLRGGVDALKAENRATAERAARMLTYFRRHEAVELRADPEEPFALGARQQTEVEISELWALPAPWVRRQLHNALWINEHFGYLWELALAGSIDSYRTSLIADTARHGLDTDAEYAALVRRLTTFLKRHLRDDGLVTCTHKQLRNKLAYEIKILRSADAEARARSAHAGRDVQISHGDNGISWLTIGGTTDQIMLAAHRLTLSARAARADGDPRTVEQLRSDLAVDLLVAGEADTSGSLPAYARPVVNLTVPVQTVMGLSDHPGVLSGGQVIPASLARTIAQSPEATWHRMLTDPAGRAVEVSTERYQPTPALWEQVVSLHPTCFRSGCDHPSTQSDLDHRIRWPEGATETTNLWPACRTDHRAKHSDGFSIVQTEDGGFALRTPAYFLHAVPDAAHPSTDEWKSIPEEIQFSATELHEALQHLREREAADRPLRADLYWEHDNLRIFYVA